MAARYLIRDDDDAPHTVLASEGTYDRACAVARKLSEAGIRTRVSMNNKSGRVLACYRAGRETYYTYSGGREFF